MAIKTWLQNRILSSFSLLKQGVVHFPLAWLYALVATVFLIIGVHYDLWSKNHYWAYAGIMGSTFGLLLSIAYGVLQRDSLSPLALRAALFVAIGSGPLFGWWGYSWMDTASAPEYIWMQMVAYYCIAGLLVYIAHFRVWNKERALADWGILLGYTGAVSYIMAGILSAGVSLTLWSVDTLFDTTVGGSVYAYVWTVAGFFFGITYFLGMMVENLSATLTVPAHGLFPRLIQWVLRPLLTVYFFVMFAYAVKIAISQELPRGIISAMVIGYGLIGFIAILQTAWMNSSENKPIWTRLFALTFPLPVFMLFIAVGRRVLDYGWTESRILLLLGILVIGIGVSGIVWKGAKALLVVALALMLVALGFAIGPYGWGAIAKQSQLNRLKEMVSLQVDDLQKAELVRHIQNRYGKESMLGLLDSTQLARLSQTFVTDKSIYWNAILDSSFSVEGMRHCRSFISGSWSSPSSVPEQFQVVNKQILTGRLQGKVIHQDLRPMADSLFKLNKGYSMNGPRMVFTGHTDSTSWRILLHNTSLSQRQKISEIQSAEGLFCWE